MVTNCALNELSFCCCSLQQLRNDVTKESEEAKKREYESGPKASDGYGGKFGVQTDRMDKVGDIVGLIRVIFGVF